MSDEIRVEPNLSAWHVPEQRVIVKHTEKKRGISLRAGIGPASTLTRTSKPRSSQKRDNALGELGLSSLSVRNWKMQSKETQLLFALSSFKQCLIIGASSTDVV